MKIYTKVITILFKSIHFSFRIYLTLSSFKKYSKKYLISFPQSGCQCANVCQIWKRHAWNILSRTLSSSPRVSIEIDLFPCRNSKLIQTSFDQSPHPCKYFEYIWGRNYSSIDASFNASFPYTWNFVYIYDHHPTPVISSLPSRTWHAADSVSFDHWIADAVPIFMEIRCSKKGPSSRHVFSIIFQRWVEYRRWNSFLNFDPLHLSLLSFNFNFRLFDVMLWSNWKFEREFVIPHRLG